MKTKGLKRILAFVCAAVLVLPVIGCGSEGTTEDKKGIQQEEILSEYVYVAEFSPLKEEENTYFGESIIIGNELYYDSHEWDEETGVYGTAVCRQNITDGSVVKIPMIFEAAEGMDSYMGRYTVSDEGCIYTTWNLSPVWEEGKQYNENDRKVFLVKYDAQGQQVYAQDITETMLKDEMNSYIQYMTVDGQGRLYASSENMIRIFDAEGNLASEVMTEGSWIMGLTSSKDGRVFFCQNGQSGMELVEIVADTWMLGETYKNLPEDYNAYLIPGVREEEDILICGANKLFSYNLKEQTSTEILSWPSCNVIGSNVRSMGAAEDGSFVCICVDYETNTNEVVRLTQKLRSEVPEKKQLLLGTFNGSSQDIQRAVVDFNKRNTEYMIEIEEYAIEYQENWTSEDYDNAVAQFNASLVGENAPDIIDISHTVDVGNLASKDALEDLTPYLESSEVISREDFVEGVLNAHTVNGKLITVPKTVQLTTLLGRTDIVGAKPGWTLKDIMELTESHPDAELMAYGTKEGILATMLQYSFDSFVDYESGTCSFESQEFMDVLAFADSFPEEYNYDDNQPSFPSRIQSGQVLLSDANIHNTQAYQMYTLMFESEVTNIGYPTFDGSQGTFMQGNEMYAVFANSENKEGAWQFLESILRYEKPDEWGMYGFPSRIDELEEVFEADMTPEYQLDENGEKMLDENGEPLQYPKTSWGYDDWDVDIYAADQEQIDDIREMLNQSKSMLTMNQTLLTLIEEEAQSYFSGQKSAEEVVKIIQSRAQVYISENY